MITLAKIISRLFEPLVVLFVLMLFGGVRAGLSGMREIWFTAYFTFLFLIIFFVRLWMVHQWKLDWDISERHKRIRPLLIILGIVFFNVFVVRSWHNRELLNLFYLLTIWLFGFFLITLRYKISGHVGIVSLGIGLFIQWFGLMMWPLYLIIPLVAWARIVQRHHTLGQTIVGVLYSSVALFIFAKISV